MKRWTRMSWQVLLTSILLIALTLTFAACTSSPADETGEQEQQEETEVDTAPETEEETAVETEEEAPAAEEGQSITVWGFVWTADWLDAIKDGFEEQHPGVTVNVERFEYDPYQDMVLTTIASGEGVPDVVTLDPMWAGDLIRGGGLQPLENADTDLNVDDFVPGGWNMYAWQGVQYGIPLDLDFNLLFYRKDVYEAAMEELGMTEFPDNTEDYLALAEQVVADTGKPAVILYQGDYYAWYQSFLAPMGGDLINDAGSEYIFNSPEGVRALQLYSDAANENEVARLWDYEADGDPMTALKNGEVMGVLHGSWFATEIASGAPEMAGQWGIAPNPWGDPNREHHSATGGACLSIPTQAENPDLAWEFIVYSMSPENQAEYFRIVSGVPSLKTSWDDPAFDETNPYFDMALGSAVADWSLGTKAMDLPSLEVADLIGDAIIMHTTGQAPAEDALNTAVEMAPPLE